MYVQAVRDAALVLRITESEAEVVARIVQGLNPIQRARFVFQASPSTFAQLEQLAVVDRNVTYADSTRANRPVAVKPSETRLTTVTVTHSPPRVNKPHASGKQIICFSCGKQGHIQRNCYVRSPHRRNQARCSVTRTSLGKGRKKIMGAVMGSPPRIEAQVAKLHLPVLLDSGSARSLITFHQFQQLNLGGPELKLLSLS